MSDSFAIIVAVAVAVAATRMLECATCWRCRLHRCLLSVIAVVPRHLLRRQHHRDSNPHNTVFGTLSSVALTVISQVICEKVEKSDIATIDKKKYLVPADLTVGQFVYVIRKRIKLSPEKAIFIFVDEVLPPTAALMSSIYEEHKDEDG
jgi:hypothetical protein